MSNCFQAVDSRQHKTKIPERRAPNRVAPQLPSSLQRAVSWLQCRELDPSKARWDLTMMLHVYIVHFFFFFKILFIYLFIYLWLCWVFVSVRGLSLVAASGDHSSSRCAGLSLSWPLLLRSTGSRHTGSVVVAHGPSCSAACGIFPDQGLNPCPLHWQADSQPLRHQGSPYSSFFVLLISMLLYKYTIIYVFICWRTFVSSFCCYE